MSNCLAIDGLCVETVAPSIERVCKRYPVSAAGVFGSVARGTCDDSSDVDIFVIGEELTEDDKRSMKEELSLSLGRHVDLLTSFRNTLPSFRRSFKRDMVVTYVR